MALGDPVCPVHGMIRCGCGGYKEPYEISPVNITQVIHYGKDDKNCSGEYYYIELKNESGQVIKEFGDWYHDKGIFKAAGFIDGITFITGKPVQLTIVKIADAF